MKKDHFLMWQFQNEISFTVSSLIQTRFDESCHSYQARDES